MSPSLYKKDYDIIRAAHSSLGIYVIHAHSTSFMQIPTINYPAQSLAVSFPHVEMIFLLKSLQSYYGRAREKKKIAIRLPAWMDWIYTLSIGHRQCDLVMNDESCVKIDPIRSKGGNSKKNNKVSMCVIYSWMDGIWIYEETIDEREGRRWWMYSHGNRWWARER